MTPFLLPVLLVAGPVRFERHDIDAFPAGYQVAVADMNGDGKPDVVALSTEADRVDWYESPGWKRHAIARTARNIDLALRDLDRDGIPEIALASGFYFSEASRGGEIQWLSRPAKPDDAWTIHPIAIDPVVHRLRWGDLDGDGRADLVHAPLFSAGSSGARDPKPAHLWAFAVPPRPASDPWEVRKIDEALTVLHGIHVSDLDADGRDEVLTASFEGIHRFDFEGSGSAGAWKKVRIAEGSKPVETAAGPSRGTSEVAPGKLGRDRPFIAAVEPWHGHEVVVYTPAKAGEPWARRVLDGGLSEGHALLVANLDGKGADEIVAGWRGGGGGLALYGAAVSGEAFERFEMDRGIAVEGAAAADMDGDGDLDLVVIAGRSNRLSWYENKGAGP